MKVKLLSNMFWPQGTGNITPKDTVLDVPDNFAEEWVQRGVAVRYVPPPPPNPPPPEARGKR